MKLSEMKRMFNGLLRLGIVAFLWWTIIDKGSVPYQSLSFGFDSPEEAGVIVGMGIMVYLFMAFCIHHITQAILDFKRKEPKRISYISIPGAILGILIIGAYIYRITMIVMYWKVNLYATLYALLGGVLLYLTIVDFKIINPFNRSRTATGASQ